MKKSLEDELHTYAGAARLDRLSKRDLGIGLGIILVDTIASQILGSSNKDLLIGEFGIDGLGALIGLRGAINALRANRYHNEISEDFYAEIENRILRDGQENN